MKRFKQFLEDEQYSAHEVHAIPDRQFLIDHESEILELIKNAYEPIGGYRGRSFSRNSKFDQVDLAKVVFDCKRKLIALAFYSTNLGGYKRFCSAGIRGNLESRAAVEAIVKDDIEPYDKWFWIEASGTIEKLFKKFNGNPIPNHLAHKFLQKPAKDLDLDKDGLHYARALELYDGNDVKKMIFGFKSARYYEKTIAEVSDYELFKLDVNQAVDDLLDEDERTSSMEKLTAAIYVINAIEELNDYCSVNELVPSLADKLLSSKKDLEEIQDDLSLSAEDQALAKKNIELAALLLKTMPKITPKQFHIESI